MAPSFEPLSTSLANGAKNGDGEVHNLRETNLKSKTIQSPHSPLPEVGVFDARSYASDELLLADVVEGMSRAGGCIVRGLIGPETLTELESEIRPYLNKAGRPAGQ